MEMDPLIITCGLTGSNITKEQTAAIPVTPDEIVASGVEAWRAGASVLHVHVRDPETGRGTQDPEVFREVVTGLRSQTDAVLCLTTSGIPGRNLPAGERLAPLALAPEMASFDGGSVNTSAGVFLNPPEFLDELAARALELGTKLELECWDTGMLVTALRYIERGAIAAPAHFQFVLGARYGMPASAESLAYLTRMLPPRSTWSAIGIGRAQLPMAITAILMGGHARVGLEDNIYYRHRELALGNGQLVERVVRLAHELERPVASSAVARRILSI